MKQALNFALCGFILIRASIPCAQAQEKKIAVTPPIIDMHLHALTVDAQGPPPLYICAPYERWPSWDSKADAGGYEPKIDKHPPFDHPLKTPDSDQGLMEQTLRIMDARNVIGVASGDPDSIAKWKKAGGDRVLPAVYFDPVSGKPTVAELRKLVSSTKVVAFAEISTQYMGVPPNSPKLEPYYALAEELDIPVGIHIGPGPPGIAYFGQGTPYPCAIPACFSLRTFWRATRRCVFGQCTLGGRCWTMLLQPFMRIRSSTSILASSTTRFRTKSSMPTCKG